MELHRPTWLNWCLDFFSVAGGWMIPTVGSSASVFLFFLFFQLTVTNFIYQGQICFCEKPMWKQLVTPWWVLRNTIRLWITCVVFVCIFCSKLFKLFSTWWLEDKWSQSWVLSCVCVCARARACNLFLQTPLNQITYWKTCMIFRDYLCESNRWPFVVLIKLRMNYLHTFFVIYFCFCLDCFQHVCYV